VPAFTTGGATLHYDVGSGDGPAAVLLHGFSSSGAAWHRLGWTKALEEAGLWPVALDFPSHGGSSRIYDSAAVQTRALAADVLALLDHLHLDRASLIGFSMGGAVALRVALDSPQRVIRVAVGGVGDAAINELHDPSQIAALAAAFAAPTDEAIEGKQLAGLRRNAVAAGNELAALLPFLKNGGWPGGLDAIGPVAVPTLVYLASDDQYMQPADILVKRLAPERVLLVADRHHHDVQTDVTVRREVVSFLSADDSS
jgi:pimeloyl-ACP methyl ester carboxylesterase